MKQIKICGILLAVLFLTIGNLAAEDKKETNEYNYEGQLELTLSLGSVTSGDMELGEETTMFIDNSYAASVKVAYFFSRLAAVEAGFTLRFDEAFYIADTTDDYSIFGELPTDDFNNYLQKLVKHFVPLVREHLTYEEELLWPIALVVVDDAAIWERIKAMADEFDY